MSKPARVLVTGAGGFLGKTVVPLLEARGYTVEPLSHAQTDLSKDIPADAVSRADAIVHLAGDVRIADSIQNPKEHIERNLSMTLNVLEACKQSGRAPLVVFVSTDRVYGKAKGTVDEESPVFPVEPYVAAKLMSETAIAAYAHVLDTPYVILRASAFFGPHQPRRGFIADVICKMLEQDSITVGPLQGVKNFTYAGNVADAILASLEAKEEARNRVYNIGGAPLSLSAVLERIRAIVEKTEGKKIQVVTDPSIKIPDKHDIGPFTLSTKAAQNSLGWSEQVSLEDGLQKTVDYFRATRSQSKNT